MNCNPITWLRARRAAKAKLAEARKAELAAEYVRALDRRDYAQSRGDTRSFHAAQVEVERINTALLMGEVWG